VRHYPCNQRSPARPDPSFSAPVSQRSPMDILVGQSSGDGVKVGVDVVGEHVAFTFLDEW
jgi:hypothetical protein